MDESKYQRKVIDEDGVIPNHYIRVDAEGKGYIYDSDEIIVGSVDGVDVNLDYKEGVSLKPCITKDVEFRAQIEGDKFIIDGKAFLIKDI